MLLYPLSRGLKVVFFYNITAATLWFCCLTRFLILLPLVGRKFLPGGIADFFHVVATLPLVGFFVVNLFGRSTYKVGDLWGLANGIRMVWICYGVIFPHPKIAKHTSYSFLIAAWSIQNLIDSCYYAFKVKTRTSPSWLFWLHHHLFFLTFPVIFGAEFALVFLSLKFVEIQWHKVILEAFLLSYVPLGYFTFGHLLERRSVKYTQFMEKKKQGRSTYVELQPAATSSAANPTSEPVEQLKPQPEEST